MLVDFLEVSLIILHAHVEAEIDVEQELDLQRIQLLHGNSSNTGIVTIRVEVVVVCLGRQHNTNMERIVSTYLVRSTR